MLTFGFPRETNSGLLGESLGVFYLFLPMQTLLLLILPPSSSFAPVSVIATSLRCHCLMINVNMGFNKLLAQTVFKTVEDRLAFGVLLHWFINASISVLPSILYRSKFCAQCKFLSDVTLFHSLYSLHFRRVSILKLKAFTWKPLGLQRLWLCRNASELTGSYKLSQHLLSRALVQNR